AVEQIVSGQPLQQEEGKSVLELARDRAIPLLLQTLKTTRKGRVARVLSGLGARQALPVLRDLAVDKSLDLSERAHIALALAELVDGRDALDEATVKTLDCLERDTSHVIRALVVYAWEHIGGRGARQASARLRDDPHPWVKRRAHFALARYAFAACAATEQDALCIQVQTLLQQAERAQRPEENFVSQLLQLGHQAAPVLAHFLPHCSFAVRLQIIDVLGRFGHPQSAAILLMVAVDASSKSKQGLQEATASLRALANSLTGQETGLLKQLLVLAKRQDTGVRSGALLCIGRLVSREKETTSMKVVLANLLHKDKQVQQAAAVALSEGFRSRHKKLLADLVSLYEKFPKTAAVREAILVALARVSLDATYHKAAFRQALIQETQSSNLNCRLLSLVLLRRLYTSDQQLTVSATRLIAPRLLDACVDVRVNAAKLLQQHVPAGLSWLVPTVRLAVCRAKPAEVAPLLKLLRRLATPQAKQVLQQATLLEDAATKQLATQLLLDWPQLPLKGQGSAQSTEGVVDARFDDGE
ncbi:MAG: hypothetical protein AAF320_05115, partial [Myxococcota bacterium]